MLDWVYLVGLWDWDGTWNGNFVWFWDMLGVDNGSFDWDWDSYWYIIWYLVNLEFWFDTVETGSDSGMGTDWGIDSIGGYGISWGWSPVGCWWGDSCWWSWDWEGWCWESTDGGSVGGWGSYLGVGCSWGSNFSGLSVLVSNLYGLGSYLNLTVSNNSGDGTVVCDSWSSMYMFLYMGWSGDDMLSNDGSWGSKSSVSCWGKSSQQLGWSSSAQCQTGRQNQKFSHVISVL